jgi:pimeloyl-ACP methyl ester carboxylesterase
VNGANVGPNTVTIEGRNELRIVADEWPGNGVPVVLAHGGGQTGHSWGGTAAVLAANGHRVLSIDLRGHGDSE